MNFTKSIKTGGDKLLNARLSAWGLSRSERGGGGNCWWICLGSELGIPYADLRRQVAQFMRDHAEIYGLLGDFETYGGFLKYCDLVATPGFFAQGNSELAAASDYAGRHIVVLGHDAEHDVVFFAGGLALGASVDLGGLDRAIYIAHWAEAAHYTGICIIGDNAWKKYSKREGFQRDAVEAEIGTKALYSILTRARGIARCTSPHFPPLLPPPPPPPPSALLPQTDVIEEVVYRFIVELPVNEDCAPIGDCTPIADDKSMVPDNPIVGIAFRMFADETILYKIRKMIY